MNIAKQVNADGEGIEATFIAFRAYTIKHQRFSSGFILKTEAHLRIPAEWFSQRVIVAAGDAEEPSRLGIAAIPKLHGLWAPDLADRKRR
jgi:hypothetical protein